MGESVVDGVVDGMVLEIVIAAGVGVVEVIHLLALLVGLLLPNLSQEGGLKFTLLLVLPVFHLLEEMILLLVGGVGLCSLEHEIKSTEIVGPPCDFEAAVFEVFGVDDLILTSEHGPINFLGILSVIIATCCVGLE